LLCLCGWIWFLLIEDNIWVICKLGLISIRATMWTGGMVVLRETSRQRHAIVYGRGETRSSMKILTKVNMCWRLLLIIFKSGWLVFQPCEMLVSWAILVGSLRRKIWWSWIHMVLAKMNSQVVLPNMQMNVVCFCCWTLRNAWRVDLC